MLPTKIDSTHLLSGAKIWVYSVSNGVVTFPAAITFYITVE